MRGFSRRNGDVQENAQKLKEKLERYRKARAFALKPNSEKETDDIKQDVEKPVVEQSSNTEPTTLKEKLERYGKARALLLEQKQAALKQAGGSRIIPAKQPVADKEPVTLVQKLERYSKARALRLKQNKEHLDGSRVGSEYQLGVG